MRFVDRARVFVRLGHRDQFRFLAAWSLLGFCRFAILVLPFRIIRRFLGENHATASDGTAVTPALSDRDWARASTIGTWIQVAARNTPWRSECYPQALTARLLLGARRIPHRISFGLRREAGALTAHCWVRAADIAVCGGDGRNYTEVASFLWVPAGRNEG